jgi:hypothetical protein
MHPFKPNLSYPKLIEYCRSHFKKSSTPLGIYKATEGYDDYRTVNCEIRINFDGSVDAHYCKGNMKMRDALKSKESKHVVGKSMSFKPIQWAIDYYCKYCPIGSVVELTLFSKKVGIHNDYIVCWEVRNF